MKKACLALISVLVFTSLFSACLPSPTSSSPPQSFVTLGQIESSQSTPPVSSTSYPNGPALTEAEAKDMFLTLYNNGYLLFERVHWGGLTDYSKSVEVNGKTYYLMKEYATKAEFADAFRASFTEAFVTRNILPLFDDSQFLHIIEQDGALYITEGGGLGGTYELWTREFSVTNTSPSQWSFLLYAHDMREDKASEHETWDFTVVYENDAWRIESMSRTFSDGFGDVTY